MSDIALVKTPDQLDAMSVLLGEQIADLEFLTLSPRSYLALRCRGIRATAVPQLLSQQDLTELPLRARALSTCWQGELANTIKLNGIDLLDLVRLENMAFFLEVLAGQRIGELIANRRPRSVYLFDRQERPCLASGRTQDHDVATAVIATELRRRGVAVRDLAPAVPRWRRIVRPLRRILSHRHPLALRSPAQVSSDVDADRPRWSPECRGQVLAIGQEVDLLTLGRLAEAAGQAPNGPAVKLVSTSLDLPNINVRTGLGVLPRENVLVLPELFPGVTIPASIRRGIDRLERRRVRGSGPLDGAHLAFHFRGLRRRLLTQVAPHVERCRRLFELAHPRAILVAGCELAEDRASVRLARARGIPTIAVPHGFVGAVDAYDFETDLFLAWGEESREHLVRELGKDGRRIPLVAPQHLASLKIGLPDEKADALLVLTARTALQCFDRLDLSEYMRAWESLIAFVGDRAELRLVVRPHPGGSDQIEFYREMLSRIPGQRGRLATDGRLEDLLPAARAVVVMTDVSTAVLAAQLTGSPTLFVRAGWRRRPWCIDSWGGEQGLVSVDAIEDVRPALARLWSDERFRQQCRDGGRLLLRRSLSYQDRPDGPVSVSWGIIERWLAARDLQRLSAEGNGNPPLGPSATTHALSREPELG